MLKIQGWYASDHLAAYLESLESADLSVEEQVYVRTLVDQLNRRLLEGWSAMSRCCLLRFCANFSGHYSE
jgi:hypothetical protein